MIHTRQCPDYLTDSVHPYSNNDPARYRLSSATGTNYSVPRTRIKFGDRAFSVAGPVVWNSLPAAVRHADSLHSFKRRLKSHFFSLCFNDWQCNGLQVRFRAWRPLNSCFYSNHYTTPPLTPKIVYWKFTITQSVFTLEGTDKNAETLMSLLMLCVLIL